MNTARQDPTRFLYLERQFCSLCRAAGQPGVRVADVRRVREIGLRAYRAERRRQAIRHLRDAHPSAWTTPGQLTNASRTLITDER